MNETIIANLVRKAEGIVYIMEGIFKPEDFSGKIGHLEDLDRSTGAADIANKIFLEWLEKQPAVYGKYHRGPLDFSWQPSEMDTHKARLVDIEEL